MKTLAMRMRRLSMPRRVALTAAVVLCVGAVAGTASAAATTRYVSPTPPAVLPPGTSCAVPGYNTIQAAVNASSAGDVIVVCPGTYPEQVTVGNSVTLTGSGNAIIQAPPTLPPAGDVVTVNNGASVTMFGFTVAGPGPSGCGSIGAGIAVLGNASLDLSNTAVRDIRDNPFSGCQNGEGIRVGRASTGNVGHATIDKVIVTGYQKNGITVDNAGSTGKITNTTVTGHGPTAVIAQNGIQVSRGAAATISTSTIRDHNYTPKSFVACGLLIFNAAGVNDANNVYLNNEKDKCTANGRGGTFEGS
jgi:hypothetical protein